MEVRKALIVAALAATLAVSSRAGGESFVDDDCDGIDDALEQFLAEKFAPVVYLEPGESNYPANVGWILQRSSLWYYEDCWPDINELVLTTVGSQERLIGPPWVHPDSWGLGHPERHCGDPPHHRRISTIAEDPDGEGSTGYSDQSTFVLPDIAEAYRIGSLDPREWVTYFHAYPTSERGVMIQYWHAFSYNDFTIGDHGGDWDATIHVQLDNNLDLKGAWFSRHRDDHPGTFKSVTELTLYQGTHILMAIDGGGHAAFASPQDWCDYNTGGSHMGTIVWGDNPDNPSQLHRVPGGLGFCDPRDSSDVAGGTVWKTWTSGDVRQAGSVEHAINPNPSRHGGLINMGEYNPCTSSTCQGTRQASTLLAGQFHPLNGQVFIRYSGRWGSIGIISSGPRGPVFQGFDGSTYTAWYNQASNMPLNPKLVLDEANGAILWYLEGEICDRRLGPLCSTKIPYLVSSTVTVPAGEILTVCPGITVRFVSGGKIKANGILNADGRTGTIKSVSNEEMTKGMKIASQFVLKNGGEFKIH